MHDGSAVAASRISRSSRDPSSPSANAAASATSASSSSRSTSTNVTIVARVARVSSRGASSAARDEPMARRRSSRGAKPSARWPSARRASAPSAAARTRASGSDSTPTIKSRIAWRSRRGPSPSVAASAARSRAPCDSASAFGGWTGIAPLNLQVQSGRPIEEDDDSRQVTARVLTARARCRLGGDRWRGGRGVERRAGPRRLGRRCVVVRVESRSGPRLTHVVDRPVRVTSSRSFRREARMAFAQVVAHVVARRDVACGCTSLPTPAPPPATRGPRVSRLSSAAS